MEHLKKVPALQVLAVPFQVTNPTTKTTTQENEPVPLDNLNSRGEGVLPQLDKLKPVTCTTLHSKSLIMCDKLQTSKDGSVDLCHSQLAEYGTHSIQQRSSPSLNKKHRKNSSKGQFNVQGFYFILNFCLFFR